MILYNVTVIVDEMIHQDWLQWMQEKHIPDVMATDCFVSNRLLKVLDSPNEGVTYCVQYVADNMGKYQEYQEKHAPGLQNEHMKRYENQFVAFRTVMEYVDETS